MNNKELISYNKILINNRRKVVEHLRVDDSQNSLSYVVTFKIDPKNVERITSNLNSILHVFNKDSLFSLKIRDEDNKVMHMKYRKVSDDLWCAIG